MINAGPRSYWIEGRGPGCGTGEYGYKPDMGQVGPGMAKGHGPRTLGDMGSELRVGV